MDVPLVAGVRTLSREHWMLWPLRGGFGGDKKPRPGQNASVAGGDRLDLSVCGMHLSIEA